MEVSTQHVGCVNVGSLTSTLPVIPYQKLTDLRYLSKGGFGTVFKAQHSDWRTTVAIKCLKIDSPVGERERNCLLKEAEVLHKARFNYIIQIFGVCNEPEFFCIITEYMCNGSLDRLLHEKDLYPELHWPLRLRTLYEIALGIADFGLSKWRQLSISKGSGSKPTEMGGTIIYMPPEEYQPNKNRKADVKYDMYSYAIIMWEVLSRQIPFEDATNPMQIMFCVLEGTRPDTGPASLPTDTPNRETLVDLMTGGWAADPEHRPTFLKCVMDLEPMLRRYDDIDFLEAVLEIKKSKLSRSASVSCAAVCEERIENKSMQFLKESPRAPWPDTDISEPGHLISYNAPPTKEGAQASFLSQTLECPGPLRDPSPVSHKKNPTDFLQIARPMNSQTLADIATLVPAPQQDQRVPASPAPHLQGPVGLWMTSRREEILESMTEACLNQSLDALLARRLLMGEDYELVANQPTRTAKVRQLLDTACRQSEDFCHQVVQTLYKNKQNRLQPYPSQIVSPTTAGVMPSAPPLCYGGYTAHRRR
ncbi:hypothetical protein NHX12_003914 [Muraenolepis orangiensis]|uniref:Receptor-interacting serine/threonine-protein kinase 2 n=1 Tax=Muraenolepis orangiensis TaxID=630683 RepID=A0A9Q0DUG2_9TELE|nr:hypothetical protein NHX12_003914 [Muraenolepis orangiensis]